MTPNLAAPEDRAIVKESCEKTIRCAQQRGSSSPCIQRSQDVIEDVKIMLGALAVIEHYETENIALRREVNSLRARLGLGSV